MHFPFINSTDQHVTLIVNCWVVC